MGVKATMFVDVELVLPSGRFAAFRRLQAYDMVGIPQNLDPQVFMFHLMSRGVVIDEVPLSVAEIAAMVLQDFLPLQKVFLDLVNGPGTVA